MKKWKNNLDEYQEQSLLKIEHNGCYLVLWGLLAAILVQTALGAGFRETLGELLVLMALTVYMLAACIRKGIWDRRFKADPLTNLLFSGAAAVLTGLVVFVTNRRRYPEYPVGGLASAVIAAASVFVLTLPLLFVLAFLYEKRKKTLERPEEDEMSAEERQEK
ncbi:DUF6773 family protein [Lachnoclostridium sp. Marseille-P6806]|uniref:DUF6773 family protein n=1 Tax=Lachnoclostridium sp. Marseille-P6806 TaxID=2364793 RepID=UPI00102F3C41|nr:DUF6773 family protein [Lachnoclostridium sp. Marseille-P6806]